MTCVLQQPELLRALLARACPRRLCCAALPVLISPKVSALKAEITEVSCRLSHIQSESHFLMGDMLIGVIFLGRYCLDQEMLETWHSVLLLGHNIIQQFTK